MKPWKRDLAYIREVGPDEPRFDTAVQRVWDRCEKLEAAQRILRILAECGEQTVEEIARRGLS